MTGFYLFLLMDVFPYLKKLCYKTRLTRVPHFCDVFLRPKYLNF